MKNAVLLLKIQLSALLGFNKILHLKDKKERRKKLAGKIAIYLCMLLLLPSIGMYAYLVGYGMDAAGLIGLFPGVMLAAICMMTLISSVSLANGTLFAFRDYELIMSLPVRPWEAALSRLILGYVCSTTLDFLIMIPCGAVYAYFVRPALSFYPVFVLTMLAAPVVPMMIGSLIGVVVARLMAGFRGAKYLQMLGSTALALGIMSLSFRMGSLSDDAMFTLFGDIGVMLSKMINRVYPLTGLYLSAVRDLDWASAAAFILIALAALAAMTCLMGRYMRGINTALTTTRAKGRFRMKKLNSSSPLMALYKKELRRYLSSTIWLFNTAFGLVLAIIGVGVLAVKGRAIINIALVSMELAGLSDGLVVCAIGFVGAFIVSVSCTTPCSISLEGKNLWLIQSMPVSGFDVLMSKMLVSLTLTVPTSVVIGLGAGLSLRFSALEIAAVTALCLSYSLTSAAVGLFVNLKSHSFEWTNDAVVVKQSAAAGISMFVNLALVIVPAVPVFLLPECALMVFWAATAAIALIGAGLTGLFRIRGDKWIRNL